MKYSVILPCAGKGKRMNLDFNKLFCYIGKKTVIERSISLFLEDERCVQIIVAYNHEDEHQIKKLVNHSKVYFIEGGNERSDSVYQAMQIVSEPKVLIHDGARPYLTKDTLEKVIECIENCDACLCGVPVIDTIKIVKEGIVEATPKRSELWQAQTPQAFTTQLLMRAYDKARHNNLKFTDDISLIEEYTSINPKMVLGDYDNIKITTPNDINKSIK